MLLQMHTKDGNMRVPAAFYVSTVVGGLCLQKKVRLPVSQ